MRPQLPKPWRHRESETSRIDEHKRRIDMPHSKNYSHYSTTGIGTEIDGLVSTLRHTLIRQERASNRIAALHRISTKDSTRKDKMHTELQREFIREISTLTDRRREEQLEMVSAVVDVAKLMTTLSASITSLSLLVTQQSTQLTMLQNDNEILREKVDMLEEQGIKQNNQIIKLTQANNEQYEVTNKKLEHQREELLDQWTLLYDIKQQCQQMSTASKAHISDTKNSLDTVKDNQMTLLTKVTSLRAASNGIDKKVKDINFILDGPVLKAVDKLHNDIRTHDTNTIHELSNFKKELFQTRNDQAEVKEKIIAIHTVQNLKKKDKSLQLFIPLISTKLDQLISKIDRANKEEKDKFNFESARKPDFFPTQVPVIGREIKFSWKSDEVPKARMEGFKFDIDEG